MKNFPCEDEGIGTGLKSSIRHTSKPLQGVKDNIGCTLEQEQYHRGMDIS
jgi:hypothetical protein